MIGGYISLNEELVYFRNEAIFASFLCLNFGWKFENSKKLLFLTLDFKI